MNKGLYGISKNRTYDTKYHTLVESASYANTASYIVSGSTDSSFRINGTTTVTGQWDSNYINGLHLSFGHPTTGPNIGQIYSIENGSAWRRLDVEGNPLILNGQSGGNVGIGTDNPNGKFEVYLDNADFTNTNASGSHIVLNNPNASGQNVISSVINGVVRAKWRTDYAGNISWVAGSGGSHAFYTNGDFQTGNPQMVIWNDGNVSIHTTAVGQGAPNTGFKLNISASNSANLLNVNNVLRVVGSNTTITGSLNVTQGITGSFSGSVVGYVPNSATSSFITNQQTSSFVTNQQTSSFVTNQQTSSMSVATASLALGPIASVGATNLYSTLPVSSVPNSTTNANNIWLGSTAGFNSTSSSFSIFLGNTAGYIATTGGAFNRSSYSLMIGQNTGLNAVSASHSTLIGRSVGRGAAGGGQSIGENNIIIGTFITLEPGRRDSINLGGVIFATGSYYSTTTVNSGSVENARVGINISNPNYNLDVSGSGNFTNGLIVTGSLKVTGGITGSFSGSVVGYVSDSQTSSFALTNADNTFTGDTNQFNTQIYVANQNNATAFNSEASIHTDGGLRVKKDAYISGTLYTNDLIVYGTSSLLNITASQLNISTNLITVNTFSPTNRYGGIAVIDSGSSPIGSGSLLYDSVQDEFIFVHKGNGNDVTSSHLLMGPETINGLGNETYVAANRLLKSQGNEHVTASNITDTDTIVSINSNTEITGSLNVSAGITGSFSGSVFGYVPNTATSSFVTNQQTSSMSVATAQTASSVAKLNQNVVITGSLIVRPSLQKVQIVSDDYASLIAGTSLNIQLGAATGNTHAIIENRNSGLIGPGDLVLQNSGGNIGIGTVTSPNTKLHISASSTQPLVNIENSKADGYSNMRFTGTGKKFVIGVANASETTFGVANDFFIYDDSVGAIRTIIDTNGNMGIGTVTTGTEANLYLGAKSTSEGGQLTLQRGTSQASASHLDNFENRFRILRGTDIENTGANSVDLQLNHTNGQLTLPKYTGSAAFTNTPTALLGVDTDGNITTTGFIDPVKGYQGAGSNIKAFPVGLSTQNFTAAAAGATNQQIRFNAVQLSTHETITGVRWYQGALQSGATPSNYNGFGLYSLSGTTLNCIVSSSNSSTIWTAGGGASSTSWNSIAFDTQPTLTAGLYYIAHLYSVSVAGTPPTFVLSAAVNNANTAIPGLTTNNKLTCTINTQTALPSSVAMSTLAASTTFQAVALY